MKKINLFLLIKATANGFLVIKKQNYKLLCEKINVQIAALQKRFSLELLLEVRGRMANPPYSSFLVEMILGSSLFWLSILFSLLWQVLCNKCCESSFFQNLTEYFLRFQKKCFTFLKESILKRYFLNFS